MGNKGCFNFFKSQKTVVIKKSTKINWRYQGNISCKDGHNKGQKWQGSDRAKEIKMIRQEYTEELCKKRP